MPSKDLSLDDEILAQRACREAAAFAELYRRHFERVYRYHIARTGDVVVAQDLTTQTFMAALEGITSYRGTGSFLAWLMGIARNKLALSYRGRKPDVPLDSLPDLEDPAPLPETLAGQRLQISQIQCMLDRLTPERAEALVLCIFSDLSAAEAGKVLGKSEAAVKMLVMRGLRDLKKIYALALQEEG